MVGTLLTSSRYPRTRGRYPSAIVNILSATVRSAGISFFSSMEEMSPCCRTAESAGSSVSSTPCRAMPISFRAERTSPPTPGIRAAIRQRAPSRISSSSRTTLWRESAAASTPSIFIAFAASIMPRTLSSTASTELSSRLASRRAHPPSSTASARSTRMVIRAILRPVCAFFFACMIASRYDSAPVVLCRVLYNVYRILYIGSLL